MGHYRPPLTVRWRLRATHSTRGEDAQAIPRRDVPAAFRTGHGGLEPARPDLQDLSRRDRRRPPGGGRAAAFGAAAGAGLAHLAQHGRRRHRATAGRRVCRSPHRRRHVRRGAGAHRAARPRAAAAAQRAGSQGARGRVGMGPQRDEFLLFGQRTEGGAVPGGNAGARCISAGAVAAARRAAPSRRRRRASRLFPFARPRPVARGDGATPGLDPGHRLRCRAGHDPQQLDAGGRPHCAGAARILGHASGSRIHAFPICAPRWPCPARVSSPCRSTRTVSTSTRVRAARRRRWSTSRRHASIRRA